MALIPCARCHRKKRKVLFELMVPVTVCVNYETHEHRTFPANTLFCGMCLHALLPTYGGLSEGLTMEPRHIVKPPYAISLYVRADGILVTRAIVPGSTETPPYMK